MSEDAFTYKDKGLKMFAKLLTENISKVKIGIPVSENARDDLGSNATIGLKHEMGTEGMPVRSFLRMPLIKRFPDALAGSLAFDKATLKLVRQQKSITPWLKKLGLIGEMIVEEAFATGGYGEWKKSDMRYKNVKMTLVETQQLRESITSVVEE